MYVTDVRAQKLEELVKSQGWGPREKTLANGVLQLLADRKVLLKRIKEAIDASDNGGGSASDAIQDMLAILDPDDK